MALKITSIVPDHGYSSGGNVTTITGTGFGANVVFTVDGTPVIPTVDSSTQVRLTMPPHSVASIQVEASAPSPQAVKNLLAVASSGQVVLTWDQPDNAVLAGVTGYRVYVTTVGFVDVVSPGVTVSGLVDGYTYDFSVYAVGTVGGGATTVVTAKAGDSVAPVITSFSLGVPTYLVVPIATFTATDNIGVVKWAVTESGTPPVDGDAAWQASAPTSYTFGSAGSKTLYGHVADAMWNKATSSPQSVTVTSTWNGLAFVDTFSNSSLDPVLWSALTAGAGTAVETASFAINSPGASDVGALGAKWSFPIGAIATVLLDVQISSVPVGDLLLPLVFFQNVNAPTVGTPGTRRLQIQLVNSGGSYYWQMYYVNGSTSFIEIAGPATLDANVTTQPRRMRLQMTATQYRLQVLHATTLAVIKDGGWRSISEIGSDGNPLWMVSGDPFTGTPAGAMTITRAEYNPDSYYVNDFSVAGSIADFDVHAISVTGAGSALEDAVGGTGKPSITGGVLLGPVPPVGYTYQSSQTAMLSGPTIADVSVQADVRAGTDGGSYPGLLARASIQDPICGPSAGTATHIQLRIEGNGNLTCYEHRATGAYVQIGSTYALGAVGGTYYTLKLKLSGSTVTCDVNGVTRITGTTTILGAGTAGVIFTTNANGGKGYVAATPGPAWDNLRVWKEA